MADLRQFFANLFGAGGAGIQGAQNAQLQNAGMLQRALQMAMQQEQFRRQGLWHQQDVDWREQQAEAAKKLAIAKMMMGIHQGAAEAMQRSTEAEKDRTWRTSESEKNRQWRESMGGGKSTAQPLFNAFNPEASTINKALDLALKQMQGNAYNEGSGNVMGNFGNIMDMLKVQGGYAFPRAPYAYPMTTPQASPTTQTAAPDFSKMSDAELMRFINGQ